MRESKFLEECITFQGLRQETTIKLCGGWWQDKKKAMEMNELVTETPWKLEAITPNEKEYKK